MNIFRLAINRFGVVITVSIVALIVLMGSILIIFRHAQAISDEMIKTTLQEPVLMAQNVATSIHDIALKGPLAQQMRDNATISEMIEEKMEVLKTPSIRYVYLLAPDGEGKYRYLADVSPMEERGFLGQKFDIPDPQWHTVIKGNHPAQIVNTRFSTIGITHIIPIRVHDKLEGVLIFDLMVNKLNAIDAMLRDLKIILGISVVGLSLVLLLVMYQAYKFYYTRSRIHVDPLTRLYNRNFLDDARRYLPLQNYDIALVDIDFFKKINDTYGHDAGDVVLQKMAVLFASVVRTRDDFVVRIGGEEFLFLLRPSRRDPFQTQHVMYRLMELIRESHIEIPSGESLNLTVSIGMAMCLSTTKSFDELLKEADVALYKAKNGGRDCLEVFTEGDKSAIPWLTVSQMKEVFESQRLVPYLQPIVDIQTGETHHYEMLARVKMADGTVLMPDQFLPVIHATLLEPRLTKRMIEYAKEILSHYPTYKLAINLSVGDLLDTTIIGILTEPFMQLCAPSLCLEILETETTSHTDALKVNIEELKRVGYTIAIDDFGSGYSNFITIADLHIDYIKFDGSLVRRLDYDTRAQTILEAIQAFSQKLGIKTIAEYVGSVSLMEAVKELGVDYAQGYAIGRPEPIEL